MPRTSKIKTTDLKSEAARLEDVAELNARLGAPEHRLNVPDKPSTMFHGDLYVVRVYGDNSFDGQVYTHVKHLWIKRDILCICHLYDDETYRFVYFPIAGLHWWQMVPERFENRRDVDVGP